MLSINHITLFIIIYMYAQIIEKYYFFPITKLLKFGLCLKMYEEAWSQVFIE